MANDPKASQAAPGGDGGTIRAHLTDLYNYFRMEFNTDPLLLFEQLCCVLARLREEPGRALFSDRLLDWYKETLSRFSQPVLGQRVPPLDAFLDRPEFLRRLIETAWEISGLSRRRRVPLGPPLAGFLETLAQSRQSDILMTPIQTAREIVKILYRDLRPGASCSNVLDPACGSGAFLNAVLEQAQEKGPDSRFHVFGLEREEHLRNCVSALSFFCQGSPVSAEIHDSGPEPALPQEAFDFVLANPPFRSQSLRIRDGGGEPLPVPTNDAHRAFIQRTLQALKPGGRGSVIVPDSFLTHSGPEAVRVRQWIIEEFQCLGIVKLPLHTFRPQATVKSSVLFLRRPFPAEAGSPARKRVFFFSVESDGRSGDTRRQPVSQNDFEELLQVWDKQEELWEEWRSQPRGTNAHNMDVPVLWNHPHFWFGSREDIRRSGYSLLPDQYQPVQLFNKPVQPPEEILKQLLTLGEEIVALTRQLAEADYDE